MFVVIWQRRKRDAFIVAREYVNTYWLSCLIKKQLPYTTLINETMLTLRIRISLTYLEFFTLGKPV